LGCIVKSRISGKEATYVEREALKRRPIRLMAPEGVEEPSSALVPSKGSEKAQRVSSASRRLAVANVCTRQEGWL
jgi:hypothetical protein